MGMWNCRRQRDLSGLCENSCMSFTVSLFPLRRPAVPFLAAIGLLAVASTVQADSAKVRAEGVVQVQIEDGPQSGRIHHFLDTAKGRYVLTFPGRAPAALKSGNRVRVTGRQSGATLALDGSGSVTTVSPAPLPNTLGEHKVALLLVNFTDNTSQPYTLAEAGSVLTQTSAFLQENSGGQTWLGGAPHGWLTLPIAQTCDATAIAAAAGQAAAMAGIGLTGYQHVVYVFPRNSACAWSGQGTVGGTSGRIWINGRLELKVLAHELGHNFGLYHSHSLECGNAVLGSSCMTYDYGDTLDDMGNTSASHFNAFQKERLGWMSSGSLPGVATVTASGTYTLAPYATGSGTRALKIPKSVNATTGARTWYYLEFRQAGGFDAVLASLAGNNIASGVIVRTGADDDINSSFLLDLTPESSAYADWNDPALVLGRSYNDAAAGVVITPLTVGSSGATVHVAMDGGSATPPPSSGGDGAVTALTVTAATDKASYSGNQTVALSATVKSGSAVVSGATVTFTITSPAGATTVLNASSDGSGRAVAAFRLARKAAKGIYQVKVQAKSTLSGSASTSFSVQ
jgi:hypothetical protein